MATAHMPVRTQSSSDMLGSPVAAKSWALLKESKDQVYVTGISRNHAWIAFDKKVYRVRLDDLVPLDDPVCPPDGPSGVNADGPAAGVVTKERRWRSAPELEELVGQIIGTREQVLACLVLQARWRGCLARRKLKGHRNVKRTLKRIARGNSHLSRDQIEPLSEEEEKKSEAGTSPEKE